MRIQHNIPAMNAYRNYNTNTKALQGNLQKLSSGYKINKAGDDAAGLAISEKMRAQITGLEVAQKNAKDGISLVQTAEGALTEVHTMLNRMYSLAEQSANGTYADEVDREQLQKEVSSLREEIDRISEATNFNGKKLLDGSLSGTGGSSAGGSVTSSLELETVDAVKGEWTLSKLAGGANVTNLNEGDKITVSFGLENGSGGTKTISVDLVVGAKQSDGSAKSGLYDADGNYLSDLAAVGTISQTEAQKAIKGLLEKDATIKENFTITNGTNDELILEAKTGGTDTWSVASSTSTKSTIAAATGVTTITDLKSEYAVTTQAVDAYSAINLANVTVWDGKESTLDKAIFEVGGEKFVLYDKGITTLSDTQKQLLADAGVGNNAQVSNVNAGTAPDNTDAGTIAAKISAATGLKAAKGDLATGQFTAGGTGTHISLQSGDSVKKSSGGLTLQIGDTSDDYNKMSVRIKHMDAASMGIGDIDISKQEGASAAMTAIKNAINYVSDTRGDLGALQNRLDHTINNLSVQQENIQDAEATIRDVDVANEMMAYTKNNILVQSAQAMLAQANQLPQGVLQLLG